MRNGLVASLWLLAFASVAQAEASAAHISDILGGQGCTVKAEAEASDPALTDYALKALEAGQAERQGDWIVLGPEICTIRPPDITSVFALDHPLVQFTIGEKVWEPEWGAFGCFFNTDALLKFTPPFARDAATRAYWGMLGKGLLEGTIALYADDISRSPKGFQLLQGDCADVPQSDAIRCNHKLFIEHFDALVRANAVLVRCEAGTSVASPELVQRLAELSEGASDNAWMFVEMMMVALAAGWVEGAGYSEKGTPRPPICTYGE